MSRFQRHLALGEKIVINGEEFLLKPLDTDHLADFFAAMRAFSGAVKASGKGEDLEFGEALRHMDNDGAQAIARLIDYTLKISFPEESEIERKQFGLKYMGELIGKIFEINSASVSSPEAQAKLRALKHGSNKPA